MAVLETQGQPGKRLGLCNAPDAASKHLVFVKLTDSSLEALNNYIKHASKSTQRPTINFSNSSGTFTVPILGEDGSSKRQQKFNFSLSSIDEQNGPQGSFECLETRRPGSLESLGPVQDKVHVQASDDAYTRFGERMSDVKKENEKRTCRYFDRNAANGLASASSSNKIVSRKHILANKSFSGGRSNDLHRYSHTHGGHGSSRQAMIDRTTTSNSSSASSASLINAGAPPQPMLNGCHPMLDRSKHKKPNNPEIMKRTLRERIVHLLAVRPYKKPELLVRMTGDGLREKEKKELFSLVKQVSVMKDNTYHLHRHIWNDVSEDWPFYSEEERQAFRRRKPQNLTPPGSDGSTGSAASGHSSSSSHPASPQPSLKRPSSSAYLPDASPPTGSSGVNETLAPAAKKKRVSNYVRPGLSPMSALGRSPRSPSSGSSGSSSGSTPHSSTSTPLMTVADSNVMSGESKTNAWLKTNQELAAASYGSEAAVADAGRFRNNDFMTKFVRIGNSEQRRSYKDEFNKDYNRYMVLHKQLDRVSQRFADLQRRLNETPKTSPDYQRLKLMIVEEYQSTNDGQFRRDQEEFQYLHKKLAHIKKLVHDYDTKYLSKGSVGLSSRPITAASS